MRFRPRLVLRLGGDGVASPTSAVGHLVAVLVAGVITVGAAASAFASASPGVASPLVLFAWLLLLARTARDAFAWLAATEAERASFRAEVQSLRPWTPPPGYAPIFDANRWARATSALALAAAGGGVAAARWHEGLVVPALFGAAFVAAGGLEWRRGRASRAESQAA